MPPIDYNPLRNRIRDLGLTQKECAEKIGISEGQLCQKMAGNYEFRQSEISKLCDLLGIEGSDIKVFFFYTQELRFINFPTPAAPPTPGGPAAPHPPGGDDRRFPIY